MVKRKSVSEKMMGNKNPEIWTFEKSKKLLEKAIEIAETKSMYSVHGNMIEGYKFDFIGEVSEEVNTYHKNITRDIPNHHPELKKYVKRLINKLERNCYSNTKKGIIREATGIVNLKSNHGWTDRQTINTNENIKLMNIDPLSDDSDDSTSENISTSETD